jgi:sigma-B regulation protein RsbU (phosphoserine phosphatase)
MSRFRQIAKPLGKSGIAFLIAFALYLLFYLTGQGGLTVLTVLVMIPLAAILAFRGLRFLKRNALWSVRNRLVFVYALIGVLPILLLFVLFGLGAWALMNELAIYLASSALNRLLDATQSAVETLEHMPPAQRVYAAPEIVKGFRHALPGLVLYVRDESGVDRFPSDSAPLDVPPEWRNANGLLVLDNHFYAWAHVIGKDAKFTALAPLSDRTVESLVPHLGAIALLEGPQEANTRKALASAGSVTEKISPSPNHFKPNHPKVTFDMDGKPVVGPDMSSRLPPAVSRFDIPVLWPSTIPHYHLETPNRTYEGVLWVSSRPSAVLSTFFAGSEVLRGVLFDILVVVAILFLIVELVAVVIGFALARRITHAVNQLYEGTRRVIRGDFRQRIPVRSHDQVGELAQSFNQMTGNIERLMVVEKEKERLQTEIEIAREVQAQLYPKEAPPIHGLQLTVRCDPARMVSGDYYDYVEIGAAKLAFAIGDVAGKGISAALLMATLQAALRAQLTHYQPSRKEEYPAAPEVDVANVISQLNKQIYANTSPEKYATFFFALFDERSRILTYTNAGHLAPLLLRNGDVVPLDSNGMVVGAFPWAKYDQSCLTMKPGDLLVCYTDGITEPENAYGEMFGEERLIDLVKKNAHENDHQIIRVVLDAVRSWTDQPELHDDMTLLLAREVQRA